MTLFDAQQALADLFVHDVSETQRMARAAAAKGYGLNPLDYSGQQGAKANMTVIKDTSSANNSSSTSRSSGIVTQALAAILSAALGAGGTWLATRSPPPVAAKPAVVAPAEITLDVSVDPATGQLKMVPAGP